MLRQSLQQFYSSKTDDELLALAADAAALTTEARPVLENEVRRRNLSTSPPVPVEDLDSGLWSQRFGGAGRNCGAFMLNLIIATLGTAVIETSVLSQVGRARSLPGMEARTWFLSLIIAGLLGFFIVRYWPMEIAKWVWILPMAILALRVLTYNHMGNSSVLFGSSVSKHFLAPDCLSHSGNCTDFLVFTIPSARALAYSLGALLSLYFRIPFCKTESGGK